MDTTSVKVQQAKTDEQQGYSNNYSMGNKAIGTKKVIFRTHQIIWYVLGVLEAVLLIRFIFRFSGANSGNQFVQFIYTISRPLIAPFRGIYQTTSFNAAVFEWVDIVAMAIYAFIAYGLVYLFQLIKPLNKNEVEQAVDSL